LDALLSRDPDAEPLSSPMPHADDNASTKLLTRARHEVHLCYEKESAVHPMPTGEVDVSYTIEATGRVTRVEVVRGLTPALDRCIERVIVGLQFPPRTSGMRVTYPYVFRGPTCADAFEAFRNAVMHDPHTPNVLAAVRGLVLAVRGVPSCQPALEWRLRELAFNWLLEDHHHVLLPAVRELLELHAAEFPKAPSAGLVQYHLGTVIATLTHCGCAGRQHDPTEWQRASVAFGRAAAIGGVEMLDWRQTRIPLVQGARRGEAICLAAVADPFVAPVDERAKAASAIAAYLAKTTDRDQRGDLAIRQEILESVALDQLTAMVSNEQISYDLQIVALELLVRRLADLAAGEARTTRASGLRRLAVVEQYAKSWPTFARCTAELEATGPAPACSREREGRYRWAESADIR
jgi:hypothetical protein